MNRPEPKSPDPAEELVGLIAQAQRRLFAFVLTLVRRRAEVDDVLQEINVVLWRKRESYRSGSDFFAWAFAIARLQVLAYYARRQGHEARFEDSLLEELSAVAAVESEMYDRREVALRGCLEKLPARQQDLILRRYQPDVAVHSLASELGKSANAVSESLRRIRDALRKCIERMLAAESS